MKKHLMKGIFLVVCLLSFAVLMQPLSVFAELGRAQKSGGTLFVGSKDEPDTLDPWKTTRTTSYSVMAHVFETLMVLDKNNNPTPSLAESWKVSKDGKVYTFKLKRGIKFHDQTPFNADAVVFSFTNMAKGNHASKIKLMESITKIDDYTVKITIKSPSIAFLFDISSGYAGIASPTAYKKYKETWGREQLVGTGPFVFKKWDARQQIVFERNDNYTHGPSILANRGPAYIEKLVFKIIPESTTLVGAIKTGDVHFMTNVPPTFIKGLKKDPSIQFFIYPSTSARFLVFNQKRELFQDKRVRFAIAHAIDKRPIAGIAFSGAAMPNCSIMGPATIGAYDVSDQCVEYNPEKSKQLLSEAGFKDIDGDGMLEKDGRKLEIGLLAYTQPENSKSAVIIQNQLKKVGLKVKNEVLEKGAAIAKAKAADFDLAEWGIGTTNGDWFLTFMGHSKMIGISNRASYINPELDKQLELATGSSQMDLYRKYVKNSQNIMLDNLAYAPLVTLASTMAAKPSVKGLKSVFTRFPKSIRMTWIIATEIYLEE